MIRLVRVELTRLRWRRAVLLVLLVAVVVPALIAISRIWDTRPVPESEVARVTAAAADDIAECVDHPRRYGVRSHDPERIEARCTQTTVGWQIHRRPLGLAAERDGGSGIGVVAVLTTLLLLIGTTFAGHDWNSGSMSNQLLFEARRGRVWAAKAIAVTLVAFVAAALISTAYWLALWTTMQVRDLTVVDGSLADSLAFGLRGAGFAAAAALGGYALTMLFRSTVATVGVLFGVAVVGGVLIGLLGIGEQWQPNTNAAAIVADGATYYVEPPGSCFVDPTVGHVDDSSGECDGQRELTLWRGAGYYGCALLLAGGASLVSFRRRDVP